MSPPRSTSPDRPLPISTILMMIAKGMTPRDIITALPDLTLDDIRSAALQTAELMKDPEASLEPFDLSVDSIIAKARQNADLSEDDAMELAVAETRAHRKEKAARRRA